MRKVKIIHKIAHTALHYYENFTSIFDCYNNSDYFVPFDTEEELTKYARKQSSFFSSTVFFFNFSCHLHIFLFFYFPFKYFISENFIFRHYIS